METLQEQLEEIKEQITEQPEQISAKSVSASPNYKGKHPLNKEELAKRRAEKRKPVYESKDPAVNPGHYKSKNGLEVIDFIQAFTEDLDGFEAYLTGSAMKYLCRWKKKNGVTDARKAVWFATKLVKYLEEQENKA